jgi:hypothetical protein
VPRLCGLGLRGGSPPWILEVEGSSIAGGLPVTVRRGEPWCAIPEAYLDDCQVADRRVKGRIIWVSANSLILNVGWRQLHEARIRYSDVLELVWEGDRRTLYLKASSKEFLDAEREAILIEARPDRVPISEALQAAWPRLSAASAAVVEAQMAGKDPAPFEKARDALNAEIKRLQSELEAAMPDPADLRSAPLIAEGMTHWDRPDAKLLWLQAFVGKQCFVDVPTGTEVVITPRSHDLQDGGRDAGTRFPDSNQGGGR